MLHYPDDDRPSVNSWRWGRQGLPLTGLVANPKFAGIADEEQMFAIWIAVNIAPFKIRQIEIRFESERLRTELLGDFGQVTRNLHLHVAAPEKLSCIRSSEG